MFDLRYYLGKLGKIGIFWTYLLFVTKSHWVSAVLRWDLIFVGNELSLCLWGWVWLTQCNICYIIYIYILLHIVDFLMNRRNYFLHKIYNIIHCVFRELNRSSVVRATTLFIVVCHLALVSRFLFYFSHILLLIRHAHRHTYIFILEK